MIGRYRRGDAHDGARYDAQTIGGAITIRSAIGICLLRSAGYGHSRRRGHVPSGHADAAVEDQRRLDGRAAFEIVIDNPSTRIHFNRENPENTLPSIRFMHPNVRSPYVSVAMVSFERTFLTNCS